MCFLFFPTSFLVYLDRRLSRSQPDIPYSVRAKIESNPILETFNAMFDWYILEMIVTETNRKAQTLKPTNWKPIDQCELRAFIGLLVYRGVLKNKGKNG